MPEYIVYLDYRVRLVIEVEARDEDEALDIADDEGYDFLTASQQTVVEVLAIKLQPDWEVEEVG